MVQALFQNRDTIPNSADISILAGASQLFFQSVTPSVPSAMFSQSLALTTGETLDFQIGPGANSYFNDNKLISVVISTDAPNNPPSANAGPAQSVNERTTVTLNGSQSSDPDGDSLTFAWTQTAGPGVTLNTATSATPTFTAPEVTADTTLTFQLVVNDGQANSAPATVNITVRDVPSPSVSGGGGSGGGGGGCTMNPIVVFDPTLPGITGFMLAFLGWKHIKKLKSDGWRSSRLQNSSKIMTNLPPKRSKHCKDADVGNCPYAIPGVVLCPFRIIAPFPS